MSPFDHGMNEMAAHLDRIAAKHLGLTSDIEAVKEAAAVLRSPPFKRPPMLADIAQIISAGWKSGKSSADVAEEILREFDASTVRGDTLSTIDAQIDRAMLEVNALSTIAKANGDIPTMYAANRAWRQLFDAREDLTKRRITISPADRS